MRESVTRTKVVPGLGRKWNRESYAEYYEPVRVLLISASAITEEGIRGIVGPHADIEITGCASAQSEIPSLLKQGKPHVLFIDYAFPELDIETILDLITTSGLETQVLFLLHTQDEEAIVRAISAGAKGCIVYSSDSSKFIQAIKTVSRGNLWLDADVLTKMLARLVSRARGATEVLKAGLTRREEEIVRLVVQGYSNKRISSELYITEKTVKAHMTSTFKKLSVHSRLELALKYRG